MSSAPNSSMQGFREEELRGKENLFSGATQMSIHLSWGHPGSLLAYMCP